MAAVTAAQRPDLLEQARGELGLDPFEHVGDGTHTAQPALFCASLAHHKQAGSPEGEMVSGHSLGELAALVAAGALADADGLRLAVTRGRLMEEASEGRPGAMLAVLGGDEVVVREIAAELGLAIGNENAPGQLVFSGDAEPIGEARKRVRAEAGAKAIRLPVSGAFHSPLMEPAVAGYREALAATEFAPSRVPVYSCTSTAPFDADPRAGLLAALTEPVLWTATLRAMHADGADTFLETGPGDVLTGLARRTVPDAEARSLAELETADA
ncbi:MAG: ACP S-malonyltransferase [Actinobacteria bacterium]|nr:ACP S-malonyltransferase [Actinomycetota bacterium]